MHKVAIQTVGQVLAKLHFARNLGLGLLVIADENDGRLPAEMPRALAEVIEMLSPGSAEVHASQFELVYKGSLREVKQLVSQGGTEW